MFTINGKILSRSVNGQIRVAIETIKELDKIVPMGYVEIVAPSSEYSIDGLKNIQIKRIGKGNPHIWEQTTYANYIRRNKSIGINFLNTHPVFRPDIAYVHDVIFSAYPHLFTSRYGKFQKMYTMLMVKSAVKLAKKIVTVSEFSKSEIKKYYNVSDDKVYVIYNAWQHMLDIVEDITVFNKHKEIRKNNYILAASGITPQKNFKWIIENAKHNPYSQYVIVGSRENCTQDDTENTDNVLYTGRVSDGELKALMHYCKAFIHPAIYEGFGLTPMEAMGSGCQKVIVSKASCLPEIYGEYAEYIDPFNPMIDIEKKINKNYCDITILLNKYSWKIAAIKLYELLEKLD